MNRHLVVGQWLVVVGIGTALSGCATSPEPAPTLADDPAIQTIHQAVEHIEDQHKVLVQVEREERATTPPPARPDGEEFETLVYLRNWNGAAFPALEAVAARMGYVMEVSGTRPAVKPMISIDADGVPAYDVLVDIADQGDRHFDLRIDEKRKVLILAYRDR